MYFVRCILLIMELRYRTVLSKNNPRLVTQWCLGVGGEGRYRTIVLILLSLVVSFFCHTTNCVRLRLHQLQLSDHVQQGPNGPHFGLAIQR